jgi:hypothetical protein
MNSTAPPSSKKPRPRAKVTSKGAGAVAQGRQAKAAGKRAVIVERDNTAPISTGSGDIYQTFINQAARPGATTAYLRKGYLAWVSMRANELPLFASDSGKQVQLSSIYTALLTEAHDVGEVHLKAIVVESKVVNERKAKLSTRVVQVTCHSVYSAIS